MKYMIILMVILTSSIGFAAETGGLAGGFLSYGGGAREIALGGNLCAVADDAGALLWNPAGLAYMQNSQASLTHGLIDEDRSRNFLAYTHPLGRINLGVGWLHAGTEGIQNRSATGQLLGEFDDSENAFIMGVGGRVYSSSRLEMMLGCGVRYFRHTLFDYMGTGAGLDLGASARLGGWRQIHSIILAASLHNLGADISWDTDTEHTDPVPTTLHAGLSLQLVPLDLLLTGSLTRPEDLDTRAHFGLEVPVQYLSIRLGLDDGDLAAGFGVPVQTGKYSLQLDYGYRNDEITDRMLHFFSVGFLY